jgi:Fe-S oxidoreductase
MKLYDSPDQEEHVWQVREAGLGATAFLPGKPDTYEGWEDSAVPPERIGDYLRDLGKLATKFGYESAMYGHYGNGCIHARWNFDLSSKPGLAKYRAFVEEGADLVVSYGGSISGEHGDGQSRAELLPKMFGPELIEAFREFKSIWDPDWKMNPGKVVDPYPLDSNIRLGPDTFNPPQVDSHFAFLKDKGSFAHAATRCVGVGKCRHTDGGVMCPSFMVTREEMHSTRGRAHLLWEMLNGEELTMWRDEAVDEALDLCLSCKGCTNDCPVSVDLPTLKAEYLSHRYQGRLRPRPAYAFGLIDQAARLASQVPGLANAATKTPLFKLAAGIHPERHVPEFAPMTLKHWFASRPLRNGGGRRVLLWADTFTNYLEPEVGIAAVEALEDAGFHVVIPQGHLCCGRPLYDYGMLDLAEAYLRRVLDTLRDEIRAGTPLVGVEPSCVAVFKDELLKLWPMNQDAQRLSKQTHHFADFLTSCAEDWEPPPLHRKALLHGHCHQQATGGTEPDQQLLERMGVEVEVLDSGCCGMAGSFGYEADKYDVSMRIGELKLLPRVRAAGAETVIVSDGFSCRGQLAAVGKTPLHLAEVLQRALRQRKLAPAASRTAERRLRRRRALRRALLLGAAGAVAIVSWQARAATAR